MGFVVTVEIQDGDECLEFTRYAELETRDAVFKEVVGKVYLEGALEQPYLVKLTQQSHAGQTTLLTKRVIPSGLEYALTVQKLHVGYLLVAHPILLGEDIRHTYPSWDELRQRFAEHLDFEQEELQRVQAEFENRPFGVIPVEGRNSVTAAVVAALCT